MSKVVRVDGNRMALEGDVSVTNAMDLRVQGEALLAELSSPVAVDLAAAGNMGSVGLSLLLCWQRKAETLGKRIDVVNMPDKMRDVSRVSGLDQMLNRP